MILYQSMSSFMYSDLKSLADLLNFNEDRDADFEYEHHSSGKNYNPHQIAQDVKSSQEKRNCENSSLKEHSTNISKSIWSDDEVLDEEEDEAKIKDKPEYQMIYQQSVTPDDIFLQLSGKGPGSDSCECLLVKIKLPGIHSKEEVDLNLSALRLICKTKKYFLSLDLPREIDPVKCSAKWDQFQSLLVVTLLFDSDFKLKY